ncbi:class I SAM-dependent methyltransferase [Bosea sp. 2YAB26]|uniref:class I SAM-dependent methyltransferase n=1 Tax=Bosea sp. 2YAB26 TaxID=3237478 RepID=UPI003F8E30AF
MSNASHEPQCAFCDSKRLGLVMDFGKVALAGGFLKPKDFANERVYPMRLHFCHDCCAVQVTDIVPADILFHDYFYFSSAIKTLRDHFEAYAEEVTRRFLTPSAARVLEIGCNDGVLLQPLADRGISTVVGVDPASNVVGTISDPRISIINDFFTEAVAENVVRDHGPMDLIMANNVYAHIPDIQGTTRAISSALAADGVFIFEVHYLGKVINELQYDMIYHEHLYYYSCISAINHFARYDMVVFDVKPVPIHAGSMRFYVCKKHSRHARSITPAVLDLVQSEKGAGFDRFETFKHFSRVVCEHRDMLVKLLTELRRDGKTIAGYGASGRANTMIQWCGINETHLDYMIDDAPAKVGYFTPASHLPIRPSSVLLTDERPDYVLVFAWSFFEEICRRNAAYLEQGGRMILPLPEISIFPKLAA